VKIAQEKIAVESATGKSSLSKLIQDREQLLTQKLETNKQIGRDRQELQQVTREITGSIIRASASGIIQELNLRNAFQFLHVQTL
jgi:HlyD family secretion protein